MNLLKPFTDWSEKNLAKHRMSMEWHRHCKEKHMISESDRNYWIDMLKHGFESGNGLTLFDRDCKELLDLLIENI